MKRVLSITLFILLAELAAAAQPNVLFTGPIELASSDHEVVIEELTLPPGFEGNVHRHDAYVYVYVVEGAVDMQVEGDELQRVSVGEVFVEDPDDVHLVMANPSETEPARFVAVIIKAADAPVARAVDDPEN